MGKWRILITEEAKRHLAQITDERVRGVIKTAILGLSADPQNQGKPLIGDLEGYRSLRVAGHRYRIIFKPEDEKAVVYVVLVALRREGDKADVYEVAKKLVKTYKEKQSRPRPSPPPSS